MNDAHAPITLVAIITVRAAAIDKFRLFERHAAAVMQRHGGRIERTIVAEVPGSADLVKEIHIVTFPGAAEFAAYRDDPALIPFIALREESVLHTDVLAGEAGPDYSLDCRPC